ncbi:unnamed protein product, partial [marine sediment metagenome]
NLFELVGTLSGIFNWEAQPSLEPERPGDIYRSSGDPSLARKILDFEPQVDFETGLRTTAAWMDQF